ncbi:TonB-linked outer membrane protein, SusC/RagA family [Arachidicoccus rhizosphaerae]|uniref:TonB-linked outer membrane protein, SusC/RagA family n=1 Tax=Arachidicoccus rhizosphaerae TaxID=551991 RepID=A0A1H4BFB6_9BACT|nr:TonB-dependent receptor [Arachidicoccus rhizosphaerae]SEA46895.1 TonB-linked outer membrane protein, SusC/RagA family [Arachidicoccus rhizosphaerae]
MQSKLRIGTLLLASLIAIRGAAQNTTQVKGTVLTQNGKSLPGVTVKVVNESSHAADFTVSDENGAFKAKLNNGTFYNFYFSYVGYADDSLTHFSINAGEHNSILFRLKEVAGTLDDVVSIGYGSARRGDLTGAISSYTPTENEAATSVSVDQMLQGKVPGVNVTNSASGPGAASSVVIRGANSLRGDNQPLYIIDNVPQPSTGEFDANKLGDNQIPENPLTTLNPSDIESVQVLKDASATAIYGSRGANGVIIITTKKGKVGKAKVNFNSNVTTAQAVGLPQMLNLEQYGEMIYAKSGVQQFYNVDGETRYVFAGNTYDPADTSSYKVIQEKNWEDEAFRTAISQNYNLSVNGGAGKTTYYLSADYKNIQGVIDATSMKVGNFRMNLNTDLSDRLKLAASLSGGVRKNNMMNGGDSRGGATGSIVNAALYGVPFEYPADDPTLTSSTDARTTALSWINDYEDLTTEKTFRASMNLSWKISNSFSYNLRSGLNQTIQDRSRWFGLELFQGFNNNGYLSVSNMNRNNFTVENLLNYNKNIRGIVNISALAGVTYDKYSSLNKITVGADFQNYLLTVNGMNYASNVTVYQPAQSDFQLLSYLARVNLSFLQDQLLLTANFRADGSSKFAKDNRWGYFPSTAIAWRMEKAKFMKSVDWVNQLKLRLGYGKTGSQSISPYQTLDFYSQSSYYADNEGGILLGINTGGLSNKDLTWESTASYNAGVDFALFDSRLSGTVDVYRKQTDDLLINKNIPVSTGYSSVILNQGSLSNKGIEISLNGDIIKKDNFSFSLGGNISFNKSKIIQLGLPESTFGSSSYVGYLGNSLGDHYGVGNIFIQGMAPGLFWGYKTDGIYQTGDDIKVTQDLNNTVPTPGSIKFVDQNGDGVIDSKDMTIIGNPNPKFTYGFNLNTTYKNFNLSANFTGVYGNQILNANLRDLATPSTSSGNFSAEAFENMWTTENPSNIYPSVTKAIYNVVTDRYIESGSYLRLSSVTLGYTFPDAVTKSIGLSRLNIYASGQNLFLITKYSGFDPEVNSFAFDGLRPGIDMNSFPNSRTFILGLNVNF